MQQQLRHHHFPISTLGDISKPSKVVFQWALESEQIMGLSVQAM